MWRIANLTILALLFSISRVFSFVEQVDKANINIEIQQNGQIDRPVISNVGGPDGGGYYFIDSNDDANNHPIFNWIDISSYGVNMGLDQDDERIDGFPIGFTFTFYGNTYTQFSASTNGWIGFGTYTSSYLTNASIPIAAAPNDILAVYWEDLHPRTAGIAYYYTNNLDTLIVSYDHWDDYTPSGFDLNFQIILTADGNILYQYANMTGTMNSYTVGIENSDGTFGLQYIYSTDLDLSNSAIHFGLNPPLTANHDVRPSILVSPIGAVRVGESIIPIVRFLNTGLFEESFPVQLSIWHGTLLYNEELTVSNLNSLEYVDLPFPAFAPNDTGYHIFSAITNLTIDEITNNDTLNAAIIAYPVLDDRTVWFVSNYGNDEFGMGSIENPLKTIQCAINASDDGDSILVLPGIYSGAGNINISIQGKQIVVKGPYGPDSTVVDCENSGVDAFHLEDSYEDSTTVIEGFTITNANNGIYLLNTSPSLFLLTFTNCSKGIFDSWLSNTQRINLRNCIFIGNSEGLVAYSHEWEVRSCAFEYNQNGIVVDGGCRVKEINCSFSNNNTAIAQFSYQAISNADSCEFINNNTAFTINLFCGREGFSGDFPLDFSNIILNNCTITGGSNGVELFCGIYRIENTSISNLTGYAIYSRTADVQLNNVTISNIQGTPLYYAGLDPEDIGSFALYNCTISDNASGFLARGRLTMDQCIYERNHGSISYGGENFGLTLSHSIFRKNLGDALIINPYSASSLPMNNISYCEFSGNGGSGIKIANEYNLSVTISNSTVCQNDSNGVAIYNNGSINMPLNNSIIGFNNGDGIFLQGSQSQITISNCDVFQNMNSNYQGIPDQTGINDNISIDPIFCNMALGNYHLGEDSPCSQQINPNSIQIGAYNVSCLYHPNIPIIMAPDNSFAADTATYFIWLLASDLDSFDVVTYSIQVDEDTAFGSPEVNQDGLQSGMTVDDAFAVQLGALEGFENLQVDTRYYWRVRSDDSYGLSSPWTDGSNYFIFMPQNHAPSAPDSGFSPANGEELISLQPVITWNIADDPDPDDFGDNLSYALRLSADSNFVGFVYYDTTTPGIVQIQPVADLLDNSQYFYQVKTIDDGGLSSNWSTRQNFWTNHYNFPPEPFPLYAPGDGYRQVIFYTHFNWGNTVDYDPLSGFTFTIQFSQDSLFNWIPREYASLTDTAIAVETDILSAISLRPYWRVLAIDDDSLSRIGGLPDAETRLLIILPPGDANANGITNGLDVTFLVNYLKGLGPSPDPYLAADANGSCNVNGLDVTYLVNYLKGIGPEPIRGNCEAVILDIEVKDAEN